MFRARSQQRLRRLPGIVPLVTCHLLVEQGKTGLQIGLFLAQRGRCGGRRRSLGSGLVLTVAPPGQKYQPQKAGHCHSPQHREHRQTGEFVGEETRGRGVSRRWRRFHGGLGLCLRRRLCLRGRYGLPGSDRRGRFSYRFGHRNRRFRLSHDCWCAFHCRGICRLGSWLRRHRGICSPGSGCFLFGYASGVLRGDHRATFHGPGQRVSPRRRRNCRCGCFFGGRCGLCRRRRSFFDFIRGGEPSDSGRVHLTREGPAPGRQGFRGSGRFRALCVLRRDFGGDRLFRFRGLSHRRRGGAGILAAVIGLQARELLVFQFQEALRIHEALLHVHQPVTKIGYLLLGTGGLFARQQEFGVATIAFGGRNRCRRGRISLAITLAGGSGTLAGRSKPQGRSIGCVGGRSGLCNSFARGLVLRRLCGRSIAATGRDRGTGLPGAGMFRQHAFRRSAIQRPDLVGGRDPKDRPLEHVVDVAAEGRGILAVERVHGLVDRRALRTHRRGERPKGIAALDANFIGARRHGCPRPRRGGIRHIHGGRRPGRRCRSGSGLRRRCFGARRDVYGRRFAVCSERRIQQQRVFTGDLAVGPGRVHEEIHEGLAHRGTRGHNDQSGGGALAHDLETQVIEHGQTRDTSAGELACRGEPHAQRFEFGWLVGGDLDRRLERLIQQ